MNLLGEFPTINKIALILIHLKLFNIPIVIFQCLWLVVQSVEYEGVEQAWCHVEQFSNIHYNTRKLYSATKAISRYIASNLLCSPLLSVICFHVFKLSLSQSEPHVKIYQRHVSSFRSET